MKQCIFFESLTGGGIYGNFSAMGHVSALIHGYFCKKFTKLGQHVNEMMAVAVKKFKNFLFDTFSYNQTKR